MTEPIGTIVFGPCKCGGYGQVYDEETEKRLGICHSPMPGGYLDEIALNAARKVAPNLRGSINDVTQLKAQIQVAVRDALDEVVANLDKKLEQQLAECQAREVVMRDALNDVLANATVHFPEHMIWPIESALATPSDSTALDTLKRQWQREALLEAVNRLNPGYGDYEWRWVCDEISSMAKELEND